jgi:hypothetical protein
MVPDGGGQAAAIARSLKNFSNVTEQKYYFGSVALDLSIWRARRTSLQWSSQF